MGCTSPASKHDVEFMAAAHKASTQSKERGRHVGAVIVDQNNEIIATACNNFPNKINDQIESRHSTKEGGKYFWSVHAEQNAIYAAARAGISVQNCSLYVSWFPCGECAKAIIQSGIKTLIAHEPDLNDSKWGHNFALTLEMLKESSVELRFIDPI